VQLHHDVRTETRLVPNITSAYEPRAFVEGTRRCPSTAPQQAATVQLDVFEYRRQNRCADALTAFAFCRRHSPKPPRRFADCRPRSCLRKDDRSTHDCPVLYCGEMNRLAVVRMRREGVSRLVWTQHSLAQWERFRCRHALNRPSHVLTVRQEKYPPLVKGLSATSRSSSTLRRPQPPPDR
jgi:hypothetical protein